PTEDPKLMKKLPRQYEDDAEAATEEFKKLEKQLKAKYPKPKEQDPDEKAAAFEKKLSEDDRKQYTELKDRSQRLTEAAPRYRPMAYSASDVTPPQVPDIAPTFVLAGGSLDTKGETVEPGFLKCIAGNSDAAEIPFAGGS